MSIFRCACALLLAVGALHGAAARAAPPSVQLEELTWTEVRDAIRAGTTTALIPIGGTEQSGPHMALGKHNYRASALAGRIAAALGNTLVAPVVAYVPEGHVTPPSGHMKFAGTLSVPDDAFVAILLGACRSLKQHGFLDIALVGDHGDYQNLLKEVARRLNREWAASPARVHYVSAYYAAASEGFAQALRARGMSEAQIGVHAGLADTSLMMAIDPGRVRVDRLQGLAGTKSSTGVAGDPALASAALGQIGTQLIVDQSVQAIRQAIAARR